MKAALPILMSDGPILIKRQLRSPPSGLRAAAKKRAPVTSFGGSLGASQR
jgi:hypothetical protein